MIYCYHGHNQPLGSITIDSLSVYLTNSCFEYKSRISVVEFVLYSCSESIEPAYYIIYLIGIDKNGSLGISRDSVSLVSAADARELVLSEFAIEETDENLDSIRPFLVDIVSAMSAECA